MATWVLWAAIGVLAVTTGLACTPVGNVRAATSVGAIGEASTGAEDDALEQLADRFSPILYLKQQSKACSRDGDAFRPVSVDTVLGNPAIELREGNSTVGQGSTAEEIGGLGPGYYLDYPGDPRIRGCQYERDAAQFSAGQPSVTYVHVAYEAGHEGFALQFWSFYYFNDWNNRHEGDWEMIQLIFAQGSPEEALGHEPVSVAYSQHGGGETAEWDSGKLEHEGEHPVVHVASGAHSNYYSDRLFFGKGENGTGFGCDDATGPARRVMPTPIVIPEDAASSGDPSAWITFEGRWGQLAGGEDNGPTGPNMKTQWRQPFTWQEGQRESSVAVPGSGFLGGNAATFFCQAVSLGAQALGFVHEWPLMTGGLAGIVMSLSVALVAVGVRDARRMEAISSATPGFLRRERRIGEMLRLGGRLYRENAGPFLAIAAVYMPLGAIALAAQELLFRTPPFSNLLGLFGREGTGAIVALLYGSLQGLFAVIFVVAVLTACIAQVEGGGRVSVRAAVRQTWRQAGALISARARALLIVGLLGISIIGVPFAVWQAVRWYFIEQAIILGKATGHEAARVSAMAVKGQWRRTAFLALTMGGVLALTGPTLSAVLILSTHIPLETVNLINSAVYMLLIPYMAAVMTLAYFDLEAKQAASADVKAPGSAAPVDPSSV